jgi:hypothetical protein
LSNLLPDSPEEVIRQVLIELEVGVFPGIPPAPVGTWPIYATSEPNLPDNVITCYDTAGQDDGREMITGTLDQHYGIQIRVRSQDHPTGWTKIAAIRQLLATQVDRMIVTLASNQSYTVFAVVKIKQILSIGKDVPNSKRSLFTLNFLAAIDIYP